MGRRVYPSPQSQSRSKVSPFAPVMRSWLSNTASPPDADTPASGQMVTFGLRWTSRFALFMSVAGDHSIKTSFDTRTC